jgi:hypothetical protein
METIMLVKDTRGYVFGALAMKPWVEAARHYGVGEGMVFKCGPTLPSTSSASPSGGGGGGGGGGQSPSPGGTRPRGGQQFQRFGWSRKNSMFQLASKDALSLGANQPTN